MLFACVCLAMSAMLWLDKSYIYKSISLFSGLIALDSGVGGVAGRWVVHVLINPAVALDGMGDRCH